jgi:hypothetical protein
MFLFNQTIIRPHTRHNTATFSECLHSTIVSQLFPLSFNLRQTDQQILLQNWKRDDSLSAMNSPDNIVNSVRFLITKLYTDLAGKTQS